MSTTGEKRLGEKYRFYVKGEDIHSYRDVTDQQIAEARDYLTKAFGVRITVIEDLDALHDSAAAYYNRPQKDDIPQAAVDRAVLLSKQYVPYNDTAGSWTADKFLAIPYQAVIPNVTYGQPPPAPLLFGPATETVNPTTPAADQNTHGTVNASVPGSTVTANSTTTSSLTSSSNPAPATAKPWYVQYWWAIGIGVLLASAGAYLAIKKHKAHHS